MRNLVRARFLSAEGEKKTTAWADRPRNRLGKKTSAESAVEGGVRESWDFQKTDLGEAYLGAKYQRLDPRYLTCPSFGPLWCNGGKNNKDGADFCDLSHDLSLGQVPTIDLSLVSLSGADNCLHVFHGRS